MEDKGYFTKICLQTYLSADIVSSAGSCSLPDSGEGRGKSSQREIHILLLGK